MPQIFFLLYALVFAASCVLRQCRHPAQTLRLKLALSLSPSILQAPQLTVVLFFNKLQFYLSCNQFTWLGVIIVVVAVSPPPPGSMLNARTANFVILYFILISGQL